MAKAEPVGGTICTYNRKHKGSVEKLKFLYMVKNNFNIQMYFNECCRKGYLDGAKWLFNNHSVNIHYDDERAFRYSCMHGHLKVAKWLYGLGGVDIHACLDCAFRFCCYGGYIDIVEWLHTLGVYVPDRINTIFQCTCGRGQLEAAKWIYKTYGDCVDIHSDRGLCFSYCCASEHLHVAEWLYSIDPTIANHKNTGYNDDCAHIDEFIRIHFRSRPNHPISPL